jgi:endonuclease-3
MMVRGTHTRAAIVAEELDKFLPDPQIPLEHRDPYTMLVAVVLSAQCTDVRVNEVTPALFALADNPAGMARQPVEAIRAIVRPCGLSERKAAAIRGLSAILAEKYGGKVPASFAELEALPGVGHKTASVVMVQSFDVPAFPVDTHIYRLAARWKLSDGSSVERTEKDLKALFPEKDWGRRHLQFIHYGRALCTARGCDGTVCPICKRLNT